MRTTVRVTLYDSEDRAVEVKARYSPATRDYFSKSFGNWLPGDAEDVEVVSVEAIDEGANVAEVEADTDAICEAVREAVEDSSDPDGDDDRAYDEWRDRRAERDD